MAKSVGRIKRWKGKDGRERICLEFWLDGVERRIYSDVDRWGRRIPLDETTAQDLLDDIRAEIRKRRSIEDALAPFLGSAAPENFFGRRWAVGGGVEARKSGDGTGGERGLAGSAAGFHQTRSLRRARR